jgi:signal transduction histidine kinase
VPPADASDHDAIWFRVGAAAIPLALAVGVGLQHHAIVPPGWQFLVALLAASPWVVESVWGRTLPTLGKAALVIACVWVLIRVPVDADVAPFFLVYLCAYSAHVKSDWRAIVAGIGSVALMIGVEVFGDWDGSFVWVLAILIAWVAGWSVEQQFRLIADLRAAQVELSAQAAADERQRIARELHDVIAHSLAVTMLHLTGARMALRRDTDEAERALLEAERLGRESMTEIRHTVGLLGPAAGAAPPMPTALDITAIVEEFRSGGLDVSYTAEGDVASLPPTTGLNLYRIAQESLANVVKHAPGSAASVWLAVDDKGARLTITNAITGGAAATNGEGGLGVRGMHDRASALGGHLDAGRVGDEWQVTAELPRILEPA